MFFEILLSTVVLVSFVGIIACWMIGVDSMFRPVANKQKDPQLFATLYQRPLDILFRPSKLSEDGLKARRRLFYALIGFLMCCLALLLAELLHERFFDATA